jgi:hypothetical protein
MTATIPMTNKSKKPYTSPRLVAFGDVRSITQAGSMNQKENPGMVGSSYNKP